MRQIAARMPQLVGSPGGFVTAMLLVAVWVATGFAAGFTQAWLLWPSAIASVVTFLIAFCIQYTQNRDTRAIQLKLDEILRAHASARSELIRLEVRSDEELRKVEDEIVETHERERREAS